MPRPLPINDPYKPSLEQKLQDIVINHRPVRDNPIFIPTVKGVETK